VNGIPHVVFDTIILFSALGWLGNPHQCVQAARQGKCLSLTCEPILAELAEKLQLKRSFDASKAAETIDEIRAFSKVVTVPGALKVSLPPPTMTPFWNAQPSGKHRVVSAIRSGSPAPSRIREWRTDCPSRDLPRLPARPINRIAELSPLVWKPAAKV
jgi:hypothetical protein